VPAPGNDPAISTTRRGALGDPFRSVFARRMVDHPDAGDLDLDTPVVPRLAVKPLVSRPAPLAADRDLRPGASVVLREAVPRELALPRLARSAPFVSVIVPVYNDPDRVVRCLRALTHQTYPKDRYEVIVIDNGSTDATTEAVARQPVKLLVEARVRSSYAARNRGLQGARGEVIAFTDADCEPVPEWLEEGVRALESEEADLVGGHVRFVHSARPSGSELFDAIAHMQQETSIRDWKVAKTANLFTRAAVFKAIGHFSGTVRSGGDVSWTRRATSRGFRLVYAPRAVVSHPTRRLAALVGKRFRIGRGRYHVRVEERAMTERARAGRPAAPVWRWTDLAPQPLSYLRKALTTRGLPASRGHLLRVWSVAWLCRITATLGLLSSVAESSAVAWMRHRLSCD
jgi:glycosyltransferase AglE